MNTISSSTVSALQAVAPAQAAKWTVSQVEALYQLPLMDLIFKAQQVHRENFNPNEIQRSALISIKTGGCPEDCNYCSQSARYKSTEREALMQVQEVVEAAKEAKEKLGVTVLVDTSIQCRHAGLAQALYGRLEPLETAA